MKTAGAILIIVGLVIIIGEHSASKLEHRR